MTTDIEIAVPRAVVAEYATNPDNATEWYVNIKSVEWVTEPPTGVGSQVAFKAGFLGREMAYIYEIQELIPGERLVMRTADGPFEMETTYTWSDIEHGRTRMSLRNSGNPTGFSRLFTPFMGFMIRRANNKDLRLLKELLESRFAG